MKRIIVACCGILIALGCFWVYNWWSGPAETQTSTAQSQYKVLGSDTTLLSWQTKYFTARYPSNLRVIVSNEVAHGTTSGQYLLGSSSMKETDQLAVTVGELRHTRLSELPAIKLRQQNASAYELEERSYVPAGSFVFGAQEEYETAVFWENDGRYAAVVVSGSSMRKAELEQALQAVVTEWSWR